MSTKEIVSKAIKDYRSKHDLTQEQLAYRLDVTPMQILRWENGKSLPNKLSMKALLVAKIIPAPID